MVRLREQNQRELLFLQRTDVRFDDLIAIGFGIDRSLLYRCDCDGRLAGNRWLIRSGNRQEHENGGERENCGNAVFHSYPHFACEMTGTKTIAWVLLIERRGASLGGAGSEEK